MPSVGSVIGTVTKQRSTKDKFKNFQDKVKKYVLREFDNPREIIIVVRDIKDPYAHVDMKSPINISRQD